MDFYGTRGTSLNWIKSFLSNRSQQVVMSGEYSAPSLVTSGVPQGSVLGPVLFLLYINDIETHVGSQMRLFADLIYRTIQSTQDHLLLQDDLNILTAWADLWLMQFNISKCKILQVSLCSKSIYQYKMNGIALQTVENHSYLGVQLNHKMSWNTHINCVCSKANKMIGFLQRILRHCPRTLKETA